MQCPPSSPPRELVASAKLLPGFSPQNRKTAGSDKFTIFNDSNDSTGNVGNLLPTPLPTSQGDISSPVRSPQTRRAVASIASVTKPGPTRVPLSTIALVKLPNDGSCVTIGRSSKSSTVALSAKNKLVSRVHAKLRYDPSDLVVIECLGWNGLSVYVPCVTKGVRVQKEYRVVKDQTIYIERVDGISVDVHGDRALVEFEQRAPLHSSDATEDEQPLTWDVPSSEPDELVPTSEPGYSSEELAARITAELARTATPAEPVAVHSAPMAMSPSRSPAQENVNAVPSDQSAHAVVASALRSLESLIPQAAAPTMIQQQLSPKSEASEIKPALQEAQQEALQAEPLQEEPLQAEPTATVERALPTISENKEPTVSSAVTRASTPEPVITEEPTVEPLSTETRAVPEATPEPVKEVEPLQQISEQPTEDLAGDLAEKLVEKLDNKTVTKPESTEAAEPAQEVLKPETEPAPKTEFVPAPESAPAMEPQTDSRAVKEELVDEVMQAVAPESKEKKQAKRKAAASGGNKRKKANQNARPVHHAMFDKEQVAKLVVNEVAYSRLSSIPISEIVQSSQTLQEIDMEELLEFVATLSAVGLIRRQGKDAVGKPLEPQCYYIPRNDDDEDRRQLAEVTKGGRTLRSCRKTHKQYFYKIPKI